MTVKVIFLVLALVGCQGSIDQLKAHVGGYTEKCIDGVVYLVFPQSVTVKFAADSHVATCDKKDVT